MKKLVIFFIFLIGCSSNSEKNYTEITIKHLRDTDSWRVEYRLPKKVIGLEFVRQFNKFRKNSWKILNTNLQIVEINNKEFITSVNKQPFDLIILEHKSFFQSLKNDHAFHVDLSYRDVYMYTGHYNVIPFYEEEQLSDPEYELRTPTNRKPIHFSFIADNEEKVFHIGANSSGAVSQWIDYSKQGTFTYWGRGNVQVEKKLNLIIDRNVPNWIKKEISTNLPRLFEYYEKKMGHSLKQKPLFLLSYTSPVAKKMDYSAGVLSGIIQANLQGREWKQRKRDNFKRLFKLLSHEAVHLWNSQLVSAKSGEPTWMREGSAEYMSIKSMYDLKIINYEQLLQKLNASLNKCLINLYDTSVAEQEKLNNDEVTQNCGLIINFLVEKSLKKKSIFVLWNLLIEEALDEDNLYGQELFLDVYDDLLVHDKSETILKLLSNKDKKHGSSLKIALDQLGIKLGEVKGEKYEFSKELTSHLFTQIYKKDCQSLVDFKINRTYVRLNRNKKCESISRRFHAYYIGDFHILKEPVKAYKEARISCRTRGYVQLLNQYKKKLKISCFNLDGPYNFFEILE